MTEPFKKKLIVKSCEEHAVWPNKGGDTETVLYAITALDESGKRWEPYPLRSFALLEIDLPMEYTVEPYENKKNGERSYTLKRPRQNTTAKVRHLEDRMDEAFERIAALEKAISVGAPEGLPDLPKGPWGT